MDTEHSRALLFNELRHAMQQYNHEDLENRQEFLALLRHAQREVEGPGAYLSRVRFEPLNNMCQLIAIETGLVRAVASSSPHPVTVLELSKRTGQERSFVARIMRLLAAHGVIEETAAETFRSNAICEELNAPHQEGATRNMVELMFPVAGKLVSQLRAPRGLSQFADDPGSVTPFIATYGQSMFQYLETNAYHKNAFDLYMASRKLSVREPWCKIVDFTEFQLQNQDSVFVVDVGGGKGHDLQAFRHRFPHISGRLVLQDLPETFNDIEESQMDGIELMPHDMFLEQPVHGARFYVFSAIMHDWSDARCRRILESTAAAMEPGYSRVLIHDMVIEDRRAGFRGASLDIVMLMMPGGMERSFSAFERLLASVGMRIVKVWPGAPGAESVVEAELVSESDLTT